MIPNLRTHRLGLLCALAVAVLMALYYCAPEFFVSPLGIVLLLPGCLFLFIYAVRIFRPR